MMYRLPRSFLFMTQFFGQEVSQELDCKDNQNDNDGCQDGHIVIVAVKSISDGYVTNTTAPPQQGKSRSQSSHESNLADLLVILSSLG